VDIERIDEAQASALARAGVASVETGPQTVGATALAECRRSFDRKCFERGVRALGAAGIRVECDLIVGLPGDTVDDFLDGLSFAIGLDPGKVQSSTLHVLPATDLWARADELGLRYDSEPAHEVIATPTIGYQDLRRAEVYARWVQQQYDARLKGE
jgi:anaerobic magnesium-protoporphyrin IX monomethyl ester cyclase